MEEKILKVLLFVVAWFVGWFIRDQVRKSYPKEGIREPTRSRDTFSLLRLPSVG